MKKLLQSIPAFVLLSPAQIYAQGIGSAEKLNLPRVAGGSDQLQIIYNIALFFLGLLCVVFIIIGGFMYTTSGGDPGKTAAAKNTILYALVGLILSLSVFAIINLVTQGFE